MSALDSLIATVAPGWALSRQRARRALALHGAWAAASRTRPAVAGWDASHGDADADLIDDLPTLRARSHDSYRQAPLAGAVIGVLEQGVVGTGLSLQPALDAAALGWSDEQARQWTDTVKRRWRLWAESPDCDITRTRNVYGLQSLAFTSLLLSGDVFPLLTLTDTPDGRTVPAVQMIEADRISNPNGKVPGSDLVAGVQLSVQGRATGYWVSRAHPGSLTDPLGRKNQWDHVPAYTRAGRPAMLHLAHRVRPGQTRGVPLLAPVLEHLKQLDRYTQAELQAAVINGAFATFVTMSPEAFDQIFQGDSRNTYLANAMQWDGAYPMAGLGGPGKAVNLLPGESVHESNPGRPNQAFDPFVMAIVRQIGARVGIPFEVLIHHYTSSYSASRAALLDAWRTFRIWRDYLASHFCQPVYEHWLDWEIAQGRIAAPGYFADPERRALFVDANWIGDGPGSIDPVKDATAAGLRVSLGISTLAAESVLHDGIEWEAKHAQRVKEQQLRRAAGLDADSAPTVAPGQPPALADPPADPEDDAEEGAEEGASAR